VPLYTVIVLVIEYSQASLIIILLETLHCHPTRVLHILQLPFLLTRVVVRLALLSFSFSAPEGVFGGNVSRWNWLISVCPKPSIHIYGLELLGVTSLALEITLPSRSVDGADVFFMQNCGEMTKFFGRFEADQVHASLPAVVSTIEPVPILKFVPRFPPTQEVMVTSKLLMKLPLLTELQLRFVEQRPPILAYPGTFLTSDKDCHGEEEAQKKEIVERHVCVC